MITIGRSIRWYKDYMSEVEFSKRHGFDFMQIWFKDGQIVIDNIDEPKEAYIKKVGYPVIIHAVFTIDDFEKYGEQLLDVLSFLEHKEVIIHPVPRGKEFNKDTACELAEVVRKFSLKTKERGITFYLENNSILDKFFYTEEEIKMVFHSNPYVELLFDVAHIDSYKHLEQIINAKYPKCIHAAGKHFNVIHEHLPLGQGDIDYKLVFSKYLKAYDGRVILEVVDEDEEIIQSKKIIDDAVANVERG